MSRIFVLIYFACHSVFALGISPFIKVDTGTVFNSVKITHPGKNTTVNPFLSRASSLSGVSPSVGVSLGLSVPLTRTVFTGFSVGMNAYNSESSYGINHTKWDGSLQNVYEKYTNKSKSSQYLGMILGSTYGPYYQYYIMPTVNRSKYEVDLHVSKVEASGAVVSVESSSVEFDRTGFGFEIGTVGNITNTTSIGLRYAMNSFAGKTVIDSVRKISNESYNTHAAGLTLIQTL